LKNKIERELEVENTFENPTSFTTNKNLLVNSKHLKLCDLIVK
jgi:hypothetical protein